MAILIPPASAAPLTGSPPSYRVAVSNARRGPVNLNGCDVHNNLLELQWSGNTAEIRIKPESYFPALDDRRVDEIAPRAYLDSAQNLDAFRRDLQDRVANGCLRSDESKRILRTITERFPLPPEISTFIRFGGASSGFVDLTSDFRLKVVAAVRKSDKTKEIVGYQTAYYRIVAAPKDAQVKVVFESVSTSESQKATVDQFPSAQLPVFPTSFKFYRLVFQTAISSSNHLATMLSAEDEAALNEALRQFETTREPSCAALSISRAACVPLAAAVAINVEFPVYVNGKRVFVLLGRTLSNGLQPESWATEIPANLRVRRLFRGRLRAVKFDRASQNIRGLALMPGDTITW